MLLRLVDHFVAAVGPELALAHAKTRLAESEARLAAHGQTCATAGFGGPSYWLSEGRRLVGDVHDCRDRVSVLEALARGEPPEPPTPIDPPERDRQVIAMAVAEGQVSPRIVTAVLSAIQARGGDPARVRQIDTQSEAVATAYRTGTHGIDQAAFERHLREALVERDKLQAAEESHQAAREAITAYLRDHAGKAIARVADVRSGLHDVRAVDQRTAIAGDPELKRLEIDLADVQSQLDALSFGGKLSASLKGGKLSEYKAAIVTDVKARRALLMNQIGEAADALASKAAAGDPAALEAVALVVQAEPSSFPAGLLDRILALQIAALESVATQAVDSLV